jgi:hypothetical protein
MLDTVTKMLHMSGDIVDVSFIDEIVSLVERHRLSRRALQRRLASAAAPPLSISKLMLLHGAELIDVCEYTRATIDDARRCQLFLAQLTRDPVQAAVNDNTNPHLSRARYSPI